MTQSVTEDLPLAPVIAPDAAPRASLRTALVFFLLSVAMHVTYLAFTPIAGTEGHRIFPAHDMVRTGWWTVPMLFDRVFLTKPPLHYWMIAASEAVFGGNLLAWRLPSLLTGAALCSACYWFGARWFGRVAGIVSGCCALGMIAVWGQSQVADIDATTTLAAALAAFCGVELLIVRPRNRWPWIAAAGLAFAAMIMSKGPGGLQIVIGVWSWPLVHAVWRWGRGGRGRLQNEGDDDAFPATADALSFIVPLLIGAAVFIGYGLFAIRSLERHGLVLDLNGLTEGTQAVRRWSFASFLRPLLIMPASQFAYALPVSLAIPIWLLSREVRDALDPGRRRIATALCASVLIGWFVCVAARLINPRYGYVTLPPLCPLAGAVAVAAARGRRSRDLLLRVAGVSAGLYAGAAVLLSVMAWRLPHVKPLLAPCSLAAVVVAVWTIRNLAASWRAAWGIAVVVVLASFPFASQRHLDRWKDSGIHTAQVLRRVTGDGAAIACGGVITSKPEILYYAHARVFYVRGVMLPSDVPPGRWVILDQAERRRWHWQRGLRLDREQWLCRNGVTDYWVAWYGGIDPLPAKNH